MNYKKGIIPLLLMFFLSVTITETFSQNNNLLRRLPRGGGGGGSSDSIAHRTGLEDSITINFRYLDSSRMRKFDSSILDFTQRFPVPSDHYHLGNIGNATHSMVYSKLMRAGWDNGFHAYDSYILNDYDTRFYNTTRPYTEIQYQFGSRYEQMLGALHTQNILPNWNASFQYRMINSTGFYQNQNTSHNNYRFGSWFQSKNKRYQNFIVVVGNKLLSGENGGIKDEAYLDSAAYKERSTIPTRLGGNTAANRNLFSSDIGTGTKYTTASFLMRQQYDFIGNKDSIVTDSSVIPLFYPRLRGEYTINYRTYNYRFTDPAPGQSVEFYNQKYGILIDSTVHNYYLQDYWNELLNDFSIYQFPDAKNSQQFVKLGATMQLLTGKFDSGTVKSKNHNFFVHGEYRNRTRNQKWDVEAFGNFYV
ncbi:MAG: hypothetical protein J7497_14585, partial [Chitinophagaceae bacterium]|nr:hypothetical protein [Chitinophagaceae bacterium]